MEATSKGGSESASVFHCQTNEPHSLYDGLFSEVAKKVCIFLQLLFPAQVHEWVEDCFGSQQCTSLISQDQSGMNPSKERMRSALYNSGLYRRLVKSVLRFSISPLEGKANMA